MPEPATTTPPAAAAAPEAIAVYARIRGTSEEVKAPEDKPGQVTARQFEFAMDRAFDAGCSQELVYDTVGAKLAALEASIDTLQLVLLSDALLTNQRQLEQR